VKKVQSVKYIACICIHTHMYMCLSIDVLNAVLCRLFDRVDLIKPVSNVRPYVCVYIRLSRKSFFDFNEIWHVGRGL